MLVQLRAQRHDVSVLHVLDPHRAHVPLRRAHPVRGARDPTTSCSSTRPRSARTTSSAWRRFLSRTTRAALTGAGVRLPPRRCTDQPLEQDPARGARRLARGARAPGPESEMTGTVSLLSRSGVAKCSDHRRLMGTVSLLSRSGVARPRRDQRGPQMMGTVSPQGGASPQGDSDPCSAADRNRSVRVGSLLSRSRWSAHRRSSMGTVSLLSRSDARLRRRPHQGTRRWGSSRCSCSSASSRSRCRSRIHLIGRRRARIVKFAALDFLLATKRRTARRFRLRERAVARSVRAIACAAVAHRARQALHVVRAQGSPGHPRPAGRGPRDRRLVRRRATGRRRQAVAQVARPTRRAGS